MGYFFFESFPMNFVYSVCSIFCSAAFDHQRSHAELMGAVNSGSLERVQVFFEGGDAKQLEALLGMKDAKFNTALIAALKNGKSEIAQFLIDKMTPDHLGMTDDEDNTALLVALKNRNEEIANILAGKMSEDQLCMENIFGLSALTLSLINGDLNVARILIDKMSGYRLEMQAYNSYFLDDEDGFTPLMMALQRGYLEIAQVLFEKLSSHQLGAQTESDITALSVAFSFGYIDFAQQILDKIGKYHVDLRALQQMLNEATPQAEKIAKMLVDRMDGQLNRRDCNGCTVLMLAACAGNLKIMQTLIEKMSINQLQEQLNIPDAQGRTALMLAVCNGKEEIVQMLMRNMSVEQQQKQLNIKDVDACTALMLSCNVETTRMLIAYMSPDDIAKQLTVQDSMGCTALMCTRDENVALFLLDNMSQDQLNVHNKMGRAALIEKLEAGRFVSARKIIDKMSVEQLGVKRFNGRTMLMHAIPENIVYSRERDESVLAIIDKIIKEDVELLGERDQQGATALTIAIRNGCWDIAQVLIDRMRIEHMDLTSGTELLALINGRVKIMDEQGESVRTMSCWRLSRRRWSYCKKDVDDNCENVL